MKKNKLILIIVALILAASILLLYNAMDEISTENGDFVYYHKEQLEDSGELQIYSVNTDISEKDKSLARFEGQYYVEPSRSHSLVFLKKFISSQPEKNIPPKRHLILFDTARKTTSTLYKSEGDSIINDVFVFPGQSKAAFTVHNSGEIDSENTNGYIFFYDREKSTTTKAIDINFEPVFYGGYTIEGFNNDANTMYIKSRGGDAGAVWGQFYTLDMETGEFSESGLPERYINRKINPGGTLSAHVEFSISDDELNNDFFRQDSYNEFSIPSYSCLKSEHSDKYSTEGYGIIVRNLSTGEENEIYRNLDFKNNLCKLGGRDITSIVWRDNDNIVFSTQLGIYEASVSESLRKSPIKTLYLFPRLHSSPDERRQPSVVRVKNNFAALSDGSLVNMETGKRLILDKGDFIDSD